MSMLGKQNLSIPNSKRFQSNIDLLTQQHILDTQIEKSQFSLHSISPLIVAEYLKVLK